MQFLVVAKDGDGRRCARAAEADPPDPSRSRSSRSSRVGTCWSAARSSSEAGDMIGSMLLVDFPDREDVDDWLAAGPVRDRTASGATSRSPRSGRPSAPGSRKRSAGRADREDRDVVPRLAGAVGEHRALDPVDDLRRRRAGGALQGGGEPPLPERALRLRVPRSRRPCRGPTCRREPAGSPGRRAPRRRRHRAGRRIPRSTDGAVRPQDQRAEDGPRHTPTPSPGPPCGRRRAATAVQNCSSVV